MAVTLAAFSRLTKSLVAAVAFITAVPALAIDTDHSITHRGQSANEATYYKDLSDTKIPVQVREYVARVLKEPKNFREKVLASALKKVGNPDYEEKDGNSNIAPGITKILKGTSIKPANSWCAASITNDLEQALGRKPPIGSTSVRQLLLQGYFTAALYRGFKNIQPGDIGSHTDSQHVFLFVMVDPNNPRFMWNIEGNAQDWSGKTPDTAHEGERLVYRPIAKTKEFISLAALHIPLNTPQ